MKKVNTSVILLLIFLLVFSIGSKSKIEQPKWEYAYYARGSTSGYSKDIPLLLDCWQEPDKKLVSGDMLLGLASKMKIDHGLGKSIWPYNLFQYAGQRGWELIFKENVADGVGFTYWFKRPKKG